MRKQVRENLLLLCNKENYEADVLINNLSLTGIKNRYIWNELQNYHMTINLVVDLMHDLLEGVCHYDFSVILEKLISVEKYFTLQIFNDRI